MDAESATALPTRLIGRLRAVLGGSSEASVTKRLAGTIFLIRVASAALAYLSQILLARWMGGSDYGVYVYVWTWVLLLGSMMDFGISASAQKIIPELSRAGRARAAARLSLRQPLDDLRRVRCGFRVAGERHQTSLAMDRRQRGRAALHRLPHAAGVRGRQYPGRHRALA